MLDIVSKNLTWEYFETDDKENFVCEINDAYVSKETGLLTVVMELNFIVPVNDDIKIKKELVESLSGINGVALKYNYADEMALSADRIAELYVPRIIRAAKTPLKNSVDLDSVTWQNNILYFNAFGHVAIERLNKELAPQISNFIHNKFNIDIAVAFRNDEENYQEIQKRIEKEIPMPVAASTVSNTATKDTSANPAASATSSKKSSDPAPIISGNGIIFGKKLEGETKKIKELFAQEGESIKVIIEGTIFHIESRPIKNERQLVTMLMTDKEDTACIKAFLKDDKWEALSKNLSEGDYVQLSGLVEWSSYDNMLNVMLDARKGGCIKKTDAPKRVETFDGKKRVELHCHTKMSAMDGLNETDDIVNQAAAWGQPAVAITDHGVVQSFPDAAAAAEKLAKKDKNIKIIYGMEGYVFDDANYTNEDGSINYKDAPTNHIIIIAKSQEGLKNLYRLVSLSHIDYFYKRPRLPKSIINKYRDGLIIGSACEAGELFSAIRWNMYGVPQEQADLDPKSKRMTQRKIYNKYFFEGEKPTEEEIKKIADFYDYFEVQPLINDRFMLEKGWVPNREAIQNINKRIIALADEMGKPVVATTDAHYDAPESAIYRNILMAGMGFKDAENGEGLYLRTTAEMLNEFSYLDDETAYRVVVENTNIIADMVEEDIRPVPKGKFPPKIDGAEETLRTTCMDRAHSIYGDPLPTEVEERLETELNSIISNGYAVMYVSAQMLVQKSLKDGYLVGSRGSVGSSFAATMAGITEVNPLDPHYLCPECKHIEWGDRKEYDCGIDMPPKKCPHCGIDMKRDGFAIPFATFLGFKGNKEPDIDLNFAGEYQAKAHKYVGVIFGEENVFKAGTVGTVKAKTAYGYVKKYCEVTGKSVNKYEMDRLASACEGVKRTTGQHPGGIVILPRGHEIYEFCPVQHPANDTTTDIVTTHFDYHKIDENLLKLDILGHTVPSMIRQLQDLTGVDPLDVDLTDRKVLSIFNGIEALDIKNPDYKYKHGSYAVPEFGTSFVRGMLDDVKPKRFEDLIRMSGFSHGTDVWLNNAQEFIRNGQATMREAISTRDDIMNYLILKGLPNDEAFKIMESVRKGKVAKGKEDNWDNYVSDMKEHDVPDWYIESCRRIQYMFPRAHAVAYTMMSFRMAWYKVYYPAEFYATYFSSIYSNFDADTILKGPDACLSRIDEIHAKGNSATDKEIKDIVALEVAYEMYSRGYEFMQAKLGVSKATKFGVENGKVVLPYAAYEGVGETAARSLEEGYNEKSFDTIEECSKRCGIGSSVIDTLRMHGLFEGIPETDQISWSM